MFRLSDLVIRHRGLVITLTVLITAFFAWHTLSVSFNADFSTYLSQDDPAVKEYNRIGVIFGGNDIGAVLLVGDEVFKSTNLNMINELTRAYEEVEGINYVTSLTNVIDFRSTDWGLEVRRLIDSDQIPQEPSELEELKAYVMNNDRYAGNLVSEDGTIAAILLQFDDGESGASRQFSTSFRVKDATDRVLENRNDSSGAKVYFGGLPFLMYNMTLMIGDNLSTLIPIMIILLVFMMYIGFRHWSGVLFPLVVVLVSTVWVTGLMGLLGLQLDMLTSIMPVVLLALGSADGIHLMKRYYELRDDGNGPGEASRISFRQMGTPILLTSVTTTVGFASLFITDFSVIRQFGLLTALGVMIALLVTLTLLPALLSFGVRYRPVEHNDPTATDTEFKGFGRLAYWIVHYKKTILTASLAVIGAAIWAIPDIEKSVDWSLCLAPGSDPHHAEMLLRERFGGSLPVQVVVSGDQKDPAILRLMSRIERRMETVPKVDKSLSMAGILAEMNQVLNGRYTVPETGQGVGNLWLLIEDKDEIERIVQTDEELGLVQAKLATWDTGPLVEAVDSLNNYLDLLPRSLSVVDLYRLSFDERRAVESQIRRQVLNELKWLLRNEGVGWPDHFEQELQAAWTNFAFDGMTRREVRETLDSYLASRQSEIGLTQTELDGLMAQLDTHFEGGTRHLTESQIETMLLNIRTGLDPDDAAWAAASLAEIIENAIGEARVRPLVDELIAANPADDIHYRNEVKGILWDLNKRYAYLDSSAPSTSQLGGNDVVREVPIDIYQSGMPQVLKGMEEALLPTQIKSLMTALLFVLVLLAIIHRSTLVALIAIVPISITIIINFGVMGYLGIGLDSFTAMIASIAIGLGIDTDIHFIARYRDELRVSGEKVHALRTTLRTTGVSILINAMAVGLGFLVLLFAGGQHVRRFGGLTSLTILVSATFSLTLLALMIVSLKPKFLVGKHSIKEFEPEYPAKKAVSGYKIDKEASHETV